MNNPDTNDQSQAVYDWEIETFPQRDTCELTLDECRELISNVWTQLLNLKDPVPPVSDGRGSRCARVYNDIIHLPRWARNRIIVIHELAHCVTSMIDHDRSITHDGLYMKIYLTMMSLVGDYKYPWLLKSAKDYGLQVSRAHFHPCIKKFQM